MNDTRKSTGQEQGKKTNKQTNHKLCVNRAKRDCVGSDHSRECSGAV
jgi:hypothetical protein